MATKCHVRSVSLPSRSHPSNVRLERELKRLEISSTSTSGSICAGLSGLENVYDSLEDVLNLASTQGEIKSLGGIIIDGSDKVLDICSILVDSMLQMQEQLRAVQSALRRRNDVSSIEAGAKMFTCFRKQLRITAKKLVVELRQKERKEKEARSQQEEVVRIFDEVDLVTRCIFRAVLAYLSVPIPKAKNSRWPFVSKVTQENLSEIVLVDVSLRELGTGFENLQVARERLEALESIIGCLETSLESLFRRLMKTRASLLNIMSQ